MTLHTQSPEVSLVETPKDPRDIFDLVGTLLADRYVVDRVVAKAGFGIVYNAHDLTLERPVAIKVAILDERLPREESRLVTMSSLQEARTVAKVRHGNIVTIYEAGELARPSGATVPWMALEWLEGRTLRDELTARRREGDGRYSVEDAFGILRPVIDAIAHAHDTGVAHRDLKPANLMLVPRRGSVMPYVLDFGIAKRVPKDERSSDGHTVTVSSSIAFTREYGAPEQFRGARTGPWTDVHALALIFTELLVGRRAYGDAPTEEGALAWYYEQATSVQRPTPARFGVVEPELEAVLTRALAGRPSERFADAGALLRALDSVIGPARPPPPLLPDAPPRDLQPVDPSRSEQRPRARSAPSKPGVDEAPPKASTDSLAKALVRVPTRRGLLLWVLGLFVLVGVALAGRHLARHHVGTMARRSDAGAAPGRPPAVAPPAAPDASLDAALDASAVDADVVEARAGGARDAGTARRTSQPIRPVVPVHHDAAVLPPDVAQPSPEPAPDASAPAPDVPAPPPDVTAPSTSPNGAAIIRKT